MAAINPPGFLHNVSTHTAQINRLSGGAGLLVPDAVGSLRALGGVRMPTDLTVTYVSGTDISLSAGVAFIPQAQNPTGGTYTLANDAAITFTLGARHATLTRYDLVVARVQDSFYSGTVNLGDFTVIAGTAASTPVDPTLPAGASYVVLYRVAVPPTGALLLTRLTKSISAVGGIQVVDASDATPGVYTDQYRSHPTLGLQKWSGSTWIDPIEAALTLRRVTAWATVGQAVGTSSAVPSVLGWAASSGNPAGWSATNSTRLIAATSGDYDVHAVILWPANATGTRGLAVRVNGGSWLFFNTRPSNEATYGAETSATYPGLAMTAGQYIEVGVWQNSGVTLTLQPGSRVGLQRVA